MSEIDVWRHFGIRGDNFLLKKETIETHAKWVFLERDFGISEWQIPTSNAMWNPRCSLPEYMKQGNFWNKTDNKMPERFQDDVFRFVKITNPFLTLKLTHTIWIFLERDRKVARNRCLMPFCNPKWQPPVCENHLKPSRIQDGVWCRFTAPTHRSHSKNINIAWISNDFHKTGSHHFGVQNGAWDRFPAFSHRSRFWNIQITLLLWVTIKFELWV